MEFIVASKPHCCSTQGPHGRQLELYTHPVEGDLSSCLCPLCRPCHPGGRGRAGGEPGQHLRGGHGMRGPWWAALVWDARAAVLQQPEVGGATLVLAVPEGGATAGGDKTGTWRLT